DYSQLALSLARLLSPPGCTYLHLSQTEEIRKQRGRFDAMVGRFFFIHQNFDNATWLLHLARLLLRPGGHVHADFYRGDPDVPQGIIFPAKSPLSSVHASCAFEYTEEDAQALAKLTGFKVVKVQRHLPMQRLFVRFERV